MSAALAAALFASTTTVAGIWAFMAHIHGQEKWLAAIAAAALPAAALAYVFDFFGSDRVMYWCSLALGFMFWWVLGFIALRRLSQRRRQNRDAR